MAGWWERVKMRWVEVLISIITAQTSGSPLLILKIPALPAPQVSPGTFRKRLMASLSAEIQLNMRFSLFTASCRTICKTYCHPPSILHRSSISAQHWSGFEGVWVEDGWRIDGGWQVFKRELKGRLVLCCDHLNEAFGEAWKLQRGHFNRSAPFGKWMWDVTSSGLRTPVRSLAYIFPGCGFRAYSSVPDWGRYLQRCALHS